MCSSETRQCAQADDRFGAVKNISKPQGQEETTLRVQSGNGSEPLLAVTRTQLEDDANKAAVLAGTNFILGFSLNVLLRWASIPNSIVRELIVSIAIAFLSSLISLSIQQKKVAALLRYVSLAFTAFTSAILWYYLFIGPLWSQFTKWYIKCQGRQGDDL